MIESETLQELEHLGNRFQGVDLKFRRVGVDWPKFWRAECFSAKHEDARHVAFGDTPAEAIEALVEIVKTAMSNA